MHAIPWDLVVIDEAHRLRNVYKPGNVIANTLKLALAGKDKLLLTATPLQNSLLELFGLVSFIDEHTFGDLKSFREQFANLSQEQVFNTLKARLRPVCHRTLRRQVLPYIKYTQRLPLVQEFTPEESEDRLYHLVSDYLQRDNLQALPASQRTLMTLVLRKLLASSTFAIAGALISIANRLRGKLRKQEPVVSWEDELDQDYEALDETAEEWDNSDDGSKQIYAAWLEHHQGSDRVTSSRSADMRSALVDYFREEGRIMIATEAGAEGINLQFCSLVVNYDLPWNPQRIEQRIGRCHRYGQQHDVVVVNFLNCKNAAEQL